MIFVLEQLFVYKFLIELLICSTLFVIVLPARNGFMLRLVSALLVCVFLSSYWSLELAQIMPFYILRYLLLFSAVVFSIWFSFDCSFKIALYCGMGGYATQHLFYKAYQLFEMFVGEVPQGGVVVAYLVLLFLTLFGVGCLFTRHIERNTYRSMESNKNLTLCGLILLCTVVFSTVYGAYADESALPMLIIASLYDCICCAFALWIQYGTFQLDRMKQEMTVVQHLWHLEKKQLAISRENIDLINIKCHDMKHLISRLAAQGGEATERELQSIQHLIDIYDFSVNTGNNILNLILAEKSLHCQKTGIQLNCIADGEKLGFMEDSDIYSLFGNAIDNAIAAVRDLPNQEKRVITLTIKAALGMLSICIENYYSGEIDFEDGLPITNSPDKQYHGYGVKSMRYMVQKYHGELTIKSEGDIFTVNILFPYEK